MPSTEGISPSPAPDALRIRSSGEPGVPLAALSFAAAHAIPYEGWCVRLPLPLEPSSLLSSALREVPTPSSLLATAWNLRDAHATALFTLSPSLPASPLACRRLSSHHASPLLHLSAASAPLSSHAASLRAFLSRHAVRILHVDGSRAAEEPAAAAFAAQVLAAALLPRDERRAKRRRGAPTRCKEEEITQPPPLLALLALLPPPHRRLREPDPSLLFSPHHIPAAHASHLRVCTFNLLDDCDAHGGAHAVWELRRLNVLRVMLAIDADAYLLQEVNEKSAAFLRATLGHEYTLELRGGVGVLYRHAAASRRALHFSPAAPPAVRRVPSPPAARRRRVCGECLHLPLRAHGLAAAPQCELILSSVHLFLKGATGQLLPANSEAHHFSSHLGRDLLRLPSRHGGAPMLLGGDFNPGRAAKQPRVGGRLSLHAALTESFRRAPDSDDEWDEDADQAVAWPPSQDCRLAADVWRDETVEERLYGGLQRGSTCLQRAMQSHLGKYQGVVARGVNEGWSPSGESTDEGHIDWILRSDAPSVGGRRLKASRVAVCTEQLCPPLPPQQDCLGVVPAGGSFFPSDHYPVFADLKLCSD
ncbi:hypothetical protein AB1Y20_007813 [Prymnesium parvum]|uniref:Endonuclease/exonuclease/phosphatase domain-containing protein n=1 Tax=Prymnesium parvum TaxID=97485 RepID=A0AB34IUU2_PRYPA